MNKPYKISEPFLVIRIDKKTNTPYTALIEQRQVPIKFTPTRGTKTLIEQLSELANTPVILMAGDLAKLMERLDE
jgi:hypothetical protein